jgi:toxin ParE1/3/4
MIAAFRLTPSANSDLREISPFTLKTWDKERQRSYLAALDRRFRWLAEEPLRGRPRPEISPGYHSCPERAHLIFCLIRVDGIDIIGIAHQTMDLPTRFGLR